LARYRPSERPYPERLPPVEYDPGLPVRRVDVAGRIDFRGRRYRVAKALRGLPVALTPHADQDGLYTVYFCHHIVRIIDLSMPSTID
jgi:hypothetical protein